MKCIFNPYIPGEPSDHLTDQQVYSTYWPLAKTREVSDIGLIIAY